MSYSEDVKKAIIDITDVFSGSDGCVSYIKFRQTMEKYAEEADNGNPDSAQLSDIVIMFNKLVSVVSE